MGRRSRPHPRPSRCRWRWCSPPLSFCWRRSSPPCLRTGSPSHRWTPTWGGKWGKKCRSKPTSRRPSNTPKPRISTPSYQQRAHMLAAHLTGNVCLSNIFMLLLVHLNQANKKMLAFPFWTANYRLLKVSYRSLSLVSGHLSGLAVTSDSKHLVILIMVTVKKQKLLQITNK